MSATCKDLSHFSFDGLQLIAGLVFILLQLLYTFFHHFHSLRLLANGHLVPSRSQLLDILLQVRLLESDNVQSLAWRNKQIHVLGTNGCILVVDYEPAGPSVEDDGVKVDRFGLPVPLHARSEFVPFGIRDE